MNCAWLFAIVVVTNLAIAVANHLTVIDHDVFIVASGIVLLVSSAVVPELVTSVDSMIFGFSVVNTNTFEHSAVVAMQKLRLRQGCYLPRVDRMISLHPNSKV